MMGKKKRFRLKKSRLPNVPFGATEQDKQGEHMLEIIIWGILGALCLLGD